MFESSGAPERLFPVMADATGIDDIMLMVISLVIACEVKPNVVGFNFTKIDPT